ncbi:uncharacterized protein LOC127619351 [Xyrauchen texanus]|uniref:uncharacterized protein LOC127619351 n=1 Tax=Xyrauchen texanus TaxID=154827 RepID=UPI002241E790|nr:uncharacterized protein LOC127619351 [Xyrauchen texanus]
MHLTNGEYLHEDPCHSVHLHLPKEAPKRMNPWKETLKLVARSPSLSLGLQGGHRKTGSFNSANRKKCDIRKTGGGPPPPEYTVAEELALSNNKGRPIMDGIASAVQSDPGAGSSKQVTLVEGNTVSLLKPAHMHTVSCTEGEPNDEDTLSVSSETVAEDFSQPAPETEASTSMGFRRNVNKVETDSVRALYKRSLEIDCSLKELDCELRRLQIQKI